MLNSAKILVACSVIVFSSYAFAQAAEPGASATGSAAQSSNDPFVQNREEKAKAKAEYKKTKAAAKQQYKDAKKDANRKLKATGQRSDTEKNLDAPSSGK